MDGIVLGAIKTALQDASLVLPRSVFLTPHESFLPSGVIFPAIGITDGRALFTEGAGETDRELFNARVICWAMMTIDGEEAMTGDGGIITLSERVMTVLHGNLLDLAACQNAVVWSCDPATMFKSDTNQWYVKRVVGVRYELEFDRGSR